MQIRPGKLADLETLMQQVRACVAGMQAAGIDQWDDFYPAENDLRRDLEHQTLHVVELEGQIAGSVTVDDVLDPAWVGLDWSAAGEPAMAVHRLMVHPDFQGRGLSRALMQAAEVIASQAGARSIRLDTYLHNPAAMALYPRLGYQRTGTARLRKGEFAGFEKLLMKSN